MTSQQPLPDVWTSRDYPVLREVARRLDDIDEPVPFGDVAAATGLPAEDVQRAATALERRQLVTVSWVMTGDGDFNGISGAAYLLTGLHPDGDDLAVRLVDALRQAADQTADESEGGRLRRAADYLADVPRNVLAGVTTAALTGGIGLGG